EARGRVVGRQVPESGERAGERLEAYTSGPAPLAHGEDVRQVTAESEQFGHDEGVALTRIARQLPECRAFQRRDLGRRCRATEHADAGSVLGEASLAEQVLRPRGGLAVARDAGGDQSLCHICHLPAKQSDSYSYTCHQTLSSTGIGSQWIGGAKTPGFSLTLAPHRGGVIKRPFDDRHGMPEKRGASQLERSQDRKRV